MSHEYDVGKLIIHFLFFGETGISRFLYCTNFLKLVIYLLLKYKQFCFSISMPSVQ